MNYCPRHFGIDLPCKFCKTNDGMLPPSYPKQKPKLNFNERLDYKEIIQRLDNGEERFMKLAVVNMVVRRLAIGCDPMEIIDHLLKRVEDQDKQLFELLMVTPVKSVKKDEAN